MTILTTEQLAAEFGISARQVQRLAKQGMPSIPVGARARRYDPTACRSWLQQNDEALTCRSSAPQPVAGKYPSASVVSAYTDACRRLHLRVTPSAPKGNAG